VYSLFSRPISTAIFVSKTPHMRIQLSLVGKMHFQAVHYAAFQRGKSLDLRL
jgi:hypothetical protein